MGTGLRTYRGFHAENDLVHFTLQLGETDLDIAIKKEEDNKRLRHGLTELLCLKRQELKDYLSIDREFQTSLTPYLPIEGAPQAALEMAAASAAVGVGPMAAVAGYFAGQAGHFLEDYSEDIIVENGGDIWLKSTRTRRIAIFAGSSPFSNRIGLEIRPETTPLGICTSSGTVGHALSFGRADAAVIIASSALLADAAATASGNMVQGISDLQPAVDFALGIPGVSGALAIIGDQLAVRGDIELVPLKLSL
ncbi:MAG TPA: UPF0280 family protein [Bacillota bacterium]|nr:UPF0280 family protein [Bacillota bacterium]